MSGKEEYRIITLVCSIELLITMPESRGLFSQRSRHQSTYSDLSFRDNIRFLSPEYIARERSHPSIAILCRGVYRHFQEGVRKQ